MRKIRELIEYLKSVELTKETIWPVLGVGILVVLIGTALLRMALSMIFGWSE